MHEQLIGPESKVENGGYPDSGTGWYSKDLEYFDQIKFLNAQRSLMNFIESFPILIIFTIVSGLYFPIPSLVGVWLNLLGRIIFIAGYNRGA